jgi:hypothetical protein
MSRSDCRLLWAEVSTFCSVQQYCIVPLQALAVKNHVVTARIGSDVGGAAADQQGGLPDDSQQQQPSKHIVLDAGDGGRISVSARSWADSIRDKLSNGGSASRSTRTSDGSEAWVPPR